MTRQRVPALLLGTRAGLPHDDRVPAAGSRCAPGRGGDHHVAAVRRAGALDRRQAGEPGRPSGDTVALMMTHRLEFHLAGTTAFRVTRQWPARPLRTADPPSVRSSSRCTRRAREE